MTKSLLNYLTYKTTNRWYSVEAHFQYWAERVSLSLLPIKTAYTSFVNVCNQLPLRLTMKQGQKSLTLRWCSLPTGACCMLLFLLHTNAAYTWFMNVCIQSTLRLPKMQDQKSMTLHWVLFSGWIRECISPVSDYKGSQYIQKEQWHT